MALEDVWRGEEVDSSFALGPSVFLVVHVNTSHSSRNFGEFFLMRLCVVLVVFSSTEVYSLFV